MQGLFLHIQRIAGRTVPGLLAAMLILIGSETAVRGADPTMGEIMNAVVEVHAEIRPDARSVASLGEIRAGSGVLIGERGLILTIGYIVMESKRIRVRPRGGPTMDADLVAYDHDTGFGLLRARGEITAAPLELGDSDALAEGDRLLVLSVGDQMPVLPVQVVSRRPFAGSWEYLLDKAIYTMPAHREFGGAALIDQAGKLVGIGSLIINDAPGPETEGYGNMFVPVDILKPVLSSLVATGRSNAPAGPWLGVYLREVQGQLLVLRVSEGGPAAAAGLLPGEVILGVDGHRVSSLEDFFRQVRARGGAGTDVPLDVLTYKDSDMSVRKLAITSRDRHGWLRMQN